jgi:hypothetical protein
MINPAYTFGAGLYSASTPSYTPGYASLNPSSGSIRWDGINKRFQIMSDYGYLDFNMGPPVHVELDFNTQQVVTWASEQMKKDLRLNILCKQYPILQNLKDELDEAKQKLEVARILVENHEKEIK